MVTVQDIGLQLTKPVKELAEWNFPFSQTLEKYCSLFNTTCNKSFGEAGLVVQNSTAVYAHRVDSLWNRTDYFRNIFSNYEHEESKNPSKKRDRKTDMCFQEFKIINFAEEVDKNIDIKKITHDNIKPKNRHFTQIEKSISQHVSIDIYDINGEIISKKYDFRCNQNISMDGILVDEFAPQDFCCGGNNSTPETSLSTSLNYSRELSCNTLTSGSVIHDDNNENTNSDAESERNYDISQEQENSNLVESLESNQQNLSSSTNTDDTLIKTSTSISNDHDVTLTNISNETCSNAPNDTNSPIITNIDSTVSLNNNDTDDKCLNNNIRQSIDVCSLLDTPPESVNSKGGRTSSTDDPALLSDTNEDLKQIKTKVVIDPIQNTLDSSTRDKMRLRSTSRSKPKSFKRKLLKPCKRGNITKKSLAPFLKEPNSSPRNRPNMFNKNLSTCIKYIREYDPLQYDDVTNAESDFLGFRLCVNTEDTNINDNVTTTLIDDEISELHSPSPTGMSPSHESFCDVWFRPDSPHFLPANVDKWHELMQPKLREAEQRSTFCIRDYASRIMNTLKASGQQKISFDAVIRKERPCEVARYFLASLDLASRKNVNINPDKDIEQNIEISLYKDEQCSKSGQADSHD